MCLTSQLAQCVQPVVQHFSCVIGGSGDVLSGMMSGSMPFEVLLASVLVAARLARVFGFSVSRVFVSVFRLTVSKCSSTHFTSVRHCT